MADRFRPGNLYTLPVAETVIGEGIIKAIVGDLRQTVFLITVLHLDLCFHTAHLGFAADFCQTSDAVIAVRRLSASDAHTL